MFHFPGTLCIVNTELWFTAKSRFPRCNRRRRFVSTCGSGVRSGETGNFWVSFPRGRLFTAHGNPRPPRLPRRLQPSRRARWLPTSRPLLKHSERQGGSSVLSSLGPSARTLSKQPQRHKDKAEPVIPSTGWTGIALSAPRGRAFHTLISANQMQTYRRNIHFRIKMYSFVHLHGPLIYCNTETRSSVCPELWTVSLK